MIMDVETDNNGAFGTQAGASNSAHRPDQQTVQQSKGKQKLKRRFTLTVDSAIVSHELKAELYLEVKSVDREGFTTKQVNGLMEYVFLTEPQLRRAVDQLNKNQKFSGKFTTSLDAAAKPKQHSYKRWVVTGYTQIAIELIAGKDGSLKLGLASALADQIGVPREHVTVEAFYENYSAVSTNSAAASLAIEKSGQMRSEKTGLLFRWIRFGVMKVCPNCAGVDCGTEPCRNRERCALCANRHVTSRCDRLGGNGATGGKSSKRRSAVRCIRCKGEGKPHNSKDWTCPVLLKRVIDDPTMFIQKPTEAAV